MIIDFKIFEYFNEPKIRYKLRYPKTDTLVWVSPEKILKRFAVDSPDYDVQNPVNRLGTRLERATEFIQKYWNDPSMIFEPSIITFYNNRLSFTDGRHRMLAAYQLGIPKVGVEVPKKQAARIQELFG